MNKERVYYLDFLRMIACFAVVMLHASARFLAEDVGSTNFWGGSIYNSLSRVGVPLFVMISGALLLDEDYNYSNMKNLRRIKKLIVFFCVWSFLYCFIFQWFYPYFVKHQKIRLMDILGSLIKGHFHLWYIYMVIGLYLILPLLRLWVKRENIKYVRYFLLLSFVFSFLLQQMVTIGTCYFEFFNGCQEILDNIGLKYVSGYSTYFILGWYLRFNDVKHKRLLYIIGVVSVLVTIAGTYVLKMKTGNHKIMLGNMNVNILFPSVAIFVFAEKNVPDKVSRSRFVQLVSRHSLGVYGIHVAVLVFANNFVEIVPLNVFITIPMTFGVTILISLIASIFLSHNRLTSCIVM